MTYLNKSDQNVTDRIRGVLSNSTNHDGVGFMFASKKVIEGSTVATVDIQLGNILSECGLVCQLGEGGIWSLGLLPPMVEIDA